MDPATRRDELLRAIEAAFDGVAREEGVTLNEAEVIDAYGTQAERKAARLKDSDRRWQEVPPAEVERHADVLPFLDPKGWRYYLPAFMAWTLLHYPTTESLAVDSTIYTLDPGDAPELKARALERYKTLSGNQAAAVCRFLRFMCDVAGEDFCDALIARRALAYWGRFCT
ncbi:MAG: hypothetical protein HY553_06935 [Elusimicrobia bacterium]|nr:hypothetical protein [Elusimicrobiota bacterium]